MKQVVLHRGKDAAVRRYHPWVFSGAIKKEAEGIADGDLVAVVDAQGEQLALGHYQAGSIRVRIIDFTGAGLAADFWEQRLEAAYAYRRRIGLAERPDTNCYRLVHAEGDGLPGLIIDVYGRTAVMQCHSIGMHRERERIAAALRQLYGDHLGAIYDKSADTLPTQYGGRQRNGYIFGTRIEENALENGHHFRLDWEGGQKTGFFLDQRDNRALLQRYVRDQRVLNAFSYSGGFSVYALAGGARWVDSVDVSAPAIALAEANAEANGFGPDRHRGHAQEVLDFLRLTTELYDVAVVDPPAFAKSLKKRHNAVQGYKRLNAAALRRLKPGGLLFTFSCSQVVDAKLFYNTLVAAALESGRQLRLMHRLGQPADHPVQIFHPEGGYLKGLVFYAR